MEASTTPNRTENDERGGRNKARKGIFLKGKVALPGIGIAIALLLLIKVLISFFYLQSGHPVISTANLALAENKGQTAPAKKAEKPPGKETLGNLKKLELTLRARERDLKKREAALAPLQKEVEGKLAELNELQNRLTVYAKKLAGREKALKDTKNGHLVSLYSAMEPAKAAAIMDKLKVPTVVLILRNMKGKSAGQIMAMMNPELGAMISEKLSQID